jgi:zinc transporter
VTNSQLQPDVPPLHAMVWDAQGVARPVDWVELAAELQRLTADPEARGFCWAHLDRSNPSHRRWLRKYGAVSALLGEALLEDETRPRQVAFEDGLLVNLRGVNLNPGAEPDDMVSLRIFVGPRLVVSLRSRRVHAVEDVNSQLLAGSGPTSRGDLLVAMADRVVDRQLPVLDNLEDSCDDIEARVFEGDIERMRPLLADLRRAVISMRRYLAPQRDVLIHLAQHHMGLLQHEAAARMREIADAQTRIVEELDALRDRAVIAQEELIARSNERLNRNMYVLSVITGVFLPLGFLTGLLGINVGGIPGGQDPDAFLIVCGLLLMVAGAVLWFFRRLRML